MDTIDISANANISAKVHEMVNGRQMAALTLKRMAKEQSLEATGEARVASIVNFNPVPLRLTGGLANYKVPAANDPSIAESMRLEFDYGKLKYKASILTLRKPHLYTKIKDVMLEEGQEKGDGRGVYDIAVCKQIEIAYDFWQAYNADESNSNDGSAMGGVLIFEGDRHALKHEKLSVPHFIFLPTGEREFYTKVLAQEHQLQQQLDKQRLYYDRQIQVAQSYFQDPDQRKNLHNVHLLWAQFGVDMGWREKAPDWLLTANDPEVTCDGCGAARKRATAWACQACGRAYNVLEAYLAGEIGIESVQMRRLQPQEWPIVHAREAEYRKMRGEFPEEHTTEPKPKGKKPE